MIDTGLQARWPCKVCSNASTNGGKKAFSIHARDGVVSLKHIISHRLTRFSHNKTRRLVFNCAPSSHLIAQNCFNRAKGNVAQRMVMPITMPIDTEATQTLPSQNRTEHMWRSLGTTVSECNQQPSLQGSGTWWGMSVMTITLCTTPDTWPAKPDIDRPVTGHQRNPTVPNKYLNITKMS